MERVRIFKQPNLRHCSYTTGDSPMLPLGEYEVVEAEMTEEEFHQMVTDEREGRITFEDIKQKYTKRK